MFFFYPKSYQFYNNALFPVIFVLFSNLKGTAKAPFVDLLELKNLLASKTAFFLPQKGTSTTILYIWESPQVKVMQSVQCRNKVTNETYWQVQSLILTSCFVSPLKLTSCSVCTDINTLGLSQRFIQKRNKASLFLLSVQWLSNPCYLDSDHLFAQSQKKTLLQFCCN